MSKFRISGQSSERFFVFSLDSFGARGRKKILVSDDLRPQMHRRATERRSDERRATTRCPFLISTCSFVAGSPCSFVAGSESDHFVQDLPKAKPLPKKKNIMSKFRVSGQNSERFCGFSPSAKKSWERGGAKQSWSATIYVPDNERKNANVTAQITSEKRIENCSIVEVDPAPATGITTIYSITSPQRE